MGLSRRGVLAAGLLGAGAAGAGRSANAGQAGSRLGSPSRFSFEALKDRARLLARAPYRPPPSPMADHLAALDFDAVGRIQYRPDAALWRDQPGADAVEFFHLGKYAREPVMISVVEAGEAREVLYSPALFDIPAGELASQLPANLGFAGFRVMNRDGHGDWIAYLGASYFRAATPFNQYGLSRPGLGDRYGGRHAPEEFRPASAPSGSRATRPGGWWCAPCWKAPAWPAPTGSSIIATGAPSLRRVEAEPLFPKTRTDASAIAPLDQHVLVRSRRSNEGRRLVARRSTIPMASRSGPAPASGSGAL